jgi:glycosyltransferase involved in cell wall biosynthesis
MSLISVIIPVYNSEKTIQETLKSVLNQTFSDFEVIVINDGSQDSTLEIISSIQDSRLKVFSYPNSGISPSRNRGLSHASGEFIAFLDHDDLWTPDKLESQLRALQENPQAAVAYSWTDLIDESNQFRGECARTNVTGNAHAKLLSANFLHTASNPLIRKEALIKVGGFDESVFGPEDWDLFLRLAAQYHFVAVPRTQVLFRVTAGSASTNVSRQEAESLKVIERAFNQAPESLQHLKKYSLSNLYMYLTFKALEVPSGRQNGFTAARCLRLAVKNDPSLLRRRQTLLKALFKITAVVLLPLQQSQALVTTAESVFEKYSKVAKPE